MVELGSTTNFPYSQAFLQGNLKPLWDIIFFANALHPIIFLLIENVDGLIFVH